MRVISLNNSSKFKIYMQLNKNVLAFKLGHNRKAILKFVKYTSISKFKNLVLLMKRYMPSI